MCTALQLTNFWQDLAIDWDRGRLYRARRGHGSRTGADPGGSRSPRDVSAVEDGHAAAPCHRTRDAVLTLDGRSAMRFDGRLRYELRATWLGGVRILDRLEEVDFDVFTHRPTLTPSRRIGDRVWTRCSRGPRHLVLLRVPDAPAGEAQRHRGGVGLLPRGGRRGRRGRAARARGQRTARPNRARSRSWLAALTRRAQRASTADQQGRALHPLVAAFGLPRQPFDDLIDGVAMDLAARSLRDHRRPAGVLPPRRVGGRADLHRDLRLPRRRRARLRDQSRHRPAVDQHHPRRRRRSRSAGASTCRRRICAGSRVARRICGAASSPSRFARCWRFRSARAREYF